MALRRGNVIDLNLVDDQDVHGVQLIGLLRKIFFKNNFNWFLLENYMFSEDLKDDLYDLNTLNGGAIDNDNGFKVYENDVYRSIQYQQMDSKKNSSQDVQICDRVYNRLNSLLRYFHKLILLSLEIDKVDGVNMEITQLRTLVTKNLMETVKDDNTKDLILPSHKFINHEYLWSFISVIPIVQDIQIDSTTINSSTSSSTILFHINHPLLQKNFVNFKFFTNSNNSLIPFTVLSYKDELIHINKSFQYKESLLKDLQLVESLNNDSLLNPNEKIAYNDYKLEKLYKQLCKLITGIDGKILFAKYDFVHNDTKILHLQFIKNISYLWKLLYIWPDCYTVVPVSSNGKYGIDYNTMPVDLNNKRKRLEKFNKLFMCFKNYDDIKEYIIPGKNETTLVKESIKDNTTPKDVDGETQMKFGKSISIGNSIPIATKKNIYQSLSTHDTLLEKIKIKEQYNIENYEKHQLQTQDNQNKIFEKNLNKIWKIIFVLDKSTPYSMNKLQDIIKDSLNDQEMIGSEEIAKILQELDKRGILRCVTYNDLKIFRIIS